MISPDKYNFKWNSFSDHLLNLMKDMLLSPSYADVTLVCEDRKPIKAHKTILRACSSVFNEIFDSSPQSSNQPAVIYLRGIKHAEMEALIDLIYTGIATFEKERLNDFLLVAKDLQIKDLCCLDEKAGIEHMTSEPGKDTPIVEANPNVQPYDKMTEPALEEDEKSLKQETTKDETNEKIKEEAKEQQENQLENVSLENVPSSEEKPNNSKEEDKEANGFMEALVAAIRTEDSLDPPAATLMLRQKLNQSKDRSCPHCDFVSNSAEIGSLVEHILSKHEGVRYVCKHCGYKATQKSNLKRHIKYKHQGLRYECPHCDSQLTTRSSLIRHMKSESCNQLSALN